MQGMTRVGGVLGWLLGTSGRAWCWPPQCRYDRQKLTLKDVHNCQYVACMNPTAGSFTIDPRLQVGRNRSRLGQLHESEAHLSKEDESVDVGWWGRQAGFPWSTPQPFRYQHICGDVERLPDLANENTDAWANLHFR